MRVVDYPLMARPDRRDINAIPVTYVGTEVGLSEVASAVETADAVAVDTETHDAIVRRSDGMWLAARVISVATRHGDPRDGTYRCFTIDLLDLDRAAVASTMAKVKMAYGWNVDFDESVLELYGAPVQSWRDAKFDEALFWAGMPGRSWYLSLAEAARRYLDIEVSGKGTVQTSYDGHSVLSEDQIRYAGHDALITLWVAEVCLERLDRDGLSAVADVEQGQRQFLKMMMEQGFPFDLERWNEYLKVHEDALVGATQQIATLTGSDTGEPNFNPKSAPELKRAFNEHEPEIVSARFGGRLFEPADAVDSSAMKELKNAGSKLAAAVLEHRKISKYLTTYGDDFAKYWFEGRVRSRYKQTITSTGRLASDKPNGQNLPGSSKEYIGVPEGRVLIDSDYSQAELRCLGEMADEPAMLDAFFAGKDLHDETARQVFDVNLSELKKTDPDEAKKIRTKVKGVNFGIPYGMQAHALATRLSNEGVPTEVSEAKSLIDKIMDSRPRMTVWLKERDAFVRNFAANPGPVDWEASFKLLQLWLRYDQERRNFRRREKHWPTPAELVDATTPTQLSLFEAPMTDAERDQLIADVSWAFRFDAPVVLRPAVRDSSGEEIWDPVAFESRTKAGRRRLFAVVMDSGFQRSDSEGGGGGDNSFTGSKKNDKFAGLLTAAMLTAATTDRPGAAGIRDRWAAENRVALPSGVDRCVQRDGETKEEFRARRREFEKDERMRCVKAFEGPNRAKKLEFVSEVCAQMGASATEFLLGKSLKDCIGALGPAFRNHPIQGGVADIAGLAFAKLYELCVEYPDLIWVQTVHDSIIGECDEANGHAIAIRKKAIMEGAMNHFYPGVPSKVDTEIRRHLGDGGLIEVIEAVAVAA